MSTQSQDYTPTPWRLYIDDIKEDPLNRKKASIVGIGITICEMYYPIGDGYGDVAEKNARRIVAAVNAADGIPTNSLEFMHIEGETPIKAIDRLRKEANAAWQQRDALLSSLKRLIVSANTVDGCYTRNPGNFASALAEMKQDAKAAQELVTTMEAK